MINNSCGCQCPSTGCVAVVVLVMGMFDIAVYCPSVVVIVVATTTDVVVDVVVMSVVMVVVIIVVVIF